MVIFRSIVFFKGLYLNANSFNNFVLRLTCGNNNEFKVGQQPFAGVLLKNLQKFLGAVVCRYSFK